jgi:hypothetical protein
MVNRFPFMSAQSPCLFVGDAHFARGFAAGSARPFVGSVAVLVGSFVALGLVGCDDSLRRIDEGGFANPGNDDDDDDEGGNAANECPAAGTATFGASFPLVQARARHTATKRPDATVMLVGGEDGDFLSTSSVELVLPAERRSVPGPALAQDRYDHAAVGMPDGSVIVAGGFSTSGAGFLSSIERFDGVSWTTVGDLDVPRAGLSGFLLDDGRALFLGGSNATEIPRTAVVIDDEGTVAVLPIDIGPYRRSAAAAKLSDGSVLVAGGHAPPDVAAATLIAADGLNASALAPLPLARRQAMASPLLDGPEGPRAVVFGGLGLADIQLYDAGTERWSSPGSLQSARASAEVVTLACAVVVCGGLVGPGNDLVSSETCEALARSDGRPLPMTATLPAATFSFSFTALDDDSALAAGGSSDGGPLDQAAVLRLE